MRARLLSVSVIVAASATAGCARRLDMSALVPADRPALTMPYSAVHEETRLYPDYNPIGAGILTEGEGPAKKKKGKSP
jgi:hypothetical protein